MNLYFMKKDSKVDSYGDIKEAFLKNKTKKKDWCEGKSAESLCRYWFNEDNNEFDKMISEKFSGFKLNDGYFEATTYFDNYKGGPRNHDLLFKKVIYNKGQMTIGIEAKGNEEYAELIKDKYQYVINTRAKGKKSNLDLRLDAIFDSLNRNNNDLSYDEFSGLRYQLFSGLIGTITEANLNKSDVALFIIHQFVTHKTITSSLETNKRDLKKYLKFIGVNKELSSGDIIEFPLKFKETNKAKIKYKSNELNVYIGYLITKLD
ncbi:hypothetical protein HF295_04555 [Hujiaoplasma nucleasis]|uniref:DUF6946 domain-containing protein n=1 Tax=Hujiaoplasma nucleasis TaxID=2725268 RepID=A0A7L6N3P4_9MOLU|nr:hypothetical protein [Hujiaoplasma nucleasis]QLY40171.1 hypothetical protein HF295_04555 [Hujiaoplasma nucleasis]